jgi:hypothetical protein
MGAVTVTHGYRRLGLYRSVARELVRTSLRAPSKSVPPFLTTPSSLLFLRLVAGPTAVMTGTLTGGSHMGLLALVAARFRRLGVERKSHVFCGVAVGSLVSVHVASAATTPAAKPTAVSSSPPSHAALVAGRLAVVIALGALLLGPPALTWFWRFAKWLIAGGHGKCPRLPWGRSLWLGTDQRVSTSKTTAYVWTYSVAGAILSFIVAGWIGHWEGFDALKRSGLDAEFALLIGGPIGAAIIAKGVVSSQVADGTTAKPAADGANPTQLVQDDNGDVSLGDTQYVLFNFIALVFFYGELVRRPDLGMPTIPDVLVGLTSVAAVGYVANKTLNGPSAISSVAPTDAAVGDTATLMTAGIVQSGDDLSVVSVTFGASKPVQPSSIASTTTQGAILQVVVPPDAAGAVPLTVSVPNGPTATWPTFKVIPTLVQTPPTASLGQSISVVTSGAAGLGFPSVSFTLGSKAVTAPTLDPNDSTGNTFRVTIPAELLEAGVDNQPEPLTITTPGGTSPSATVIVTQPPAP